MTCENCKDCTLIDTLYSTLQRPLIRSQLLRKICDYTEDVRVMNKNQDIVGYSYSEKTRGQMKKEYELKQDELRGLYNLAIKELKEGLAESILDFLVEEKMKREYK